MSNLPNVVRPCCRGAAALRRPPSHRETMSNSIHASFHEHYIFHRRAANRFLALCPRLFNIARRCLACRVQRGPLGVLPKAKRPRGGVYIYKIYFGLNMRQVQYNYIYTSSTDSASGLKNQTTSPANLIQICSIFVKPT